MIRLLKEQSRSTANSISCTVHRPLFKSSQLFSLWSTTFVFPSGRNLLDLSTLPYVLSRISFLILLCFLLGLAFCIIRSTLSFSKWRSMTSLQVTIRDVGPTVSLLLRDGILLPALERRHSSGWLLGGSSFRS